MREDALIAALAKDLRPVRRLWAPPVRMLVWLLAVLVMAGGAAWLADMDAVRARMAEAPDLRYSLLGSVLTAGVAGLAALELSVPGRSGWWVAAPVLPGVLWFGASGWGCLEAWRWPGLTEVTFGESVGCVRFITLASVPLSLVLLWLLRRACPLWPGRVAAMGGLAAAAAAASLLVLFHAYDSSALDLVMHAVAVGVVVGGCRVVGAVMG